MTTSATYLKNFFNETEKVDHDDEFTFEANGDTHIMSYGVVVEAIHGAPENEKKKIANVIRKIDFVDGDVCDFLRHLGRALAANR